MTVDRAKLRALAQAATKRGACTIEPTTLTELLDALDAAEARSMPEADIDLDAGCSDEEMKRRVERSKERLAKAMRSPALDAAEAAGYARGVEEAAACVASRTRQWHMSSPCRSEGMVHEARILALLARKP